MTESGRYLVVRVNASLIDFMKSQKLLRQFICPLSVIRACGLHVSTLLCLLLYVGVCFCSCTFVIARPSSWFDGLCTLVFIRFTVYYCLHAKDHGHPAPLVLGCYEQVFCPSSCCFLFLPIWGGGLPQPPMLLEVYTSIECMAGHVKCSSMPVCTLLDLNACVNAHMCGCFAPI